MKILITAGSVYGSLDDNKIVSNRARGIWATKFAKEAANAGHEVHVLVPDTFPEDVIRALRKDLVVPRVEKPCIIHQHKGFIDYMNQCCELAPQMDSAVMAAAVVNWIPHNPVKGKMATKGYTEGQVIQVPFYLAPRVINKMKEWNPKITLIGCKMLSGSAQDELVEAAYGALLQARCNVVVANDLSNLRTKYLVYQDRSVVTCEGEVGFECLYRNLFAVLNDVHYKTHLTLGDFGGGFLTNVVATAKEKFNLIVDEHREGFVRKQAGISDKVFGSVAVRVPGHGWLVSPREKDRMFTASNAVLVTEVKDRTVRVYGNSKATLNAPLLINVGEKYGADAVLHQHTQLEGVPTVEYAPPGTARDNERDIPASTFNIKGHGFVGCLKINHGA